MIQMNQADSAPETEGSLLSKWGLLFNLPTPINSTPWKSAASSRINLFSLQPKMNAYRQIKRLIVLLTRIGQV